MTDAQKWFDLEQEIEQRWLREFARQTNEMEARFAEERQALFSIAGYVSEYSGTPFSGNITPEILVSARDFVQKGVHFDFLMKEIKRQPSATDQWEQLMLILQLSADDDTPSINI